MIFWVIVVFAAIAVAELPYLIKNKRKKELALFSVIFLIGFVTSILISLKINVTSPVMLLDDFLEKVLHIGYDV